jgi:hypothetical protein
MDVENDTVYLNAQRQNEIVLGVAEYFGGGDLSAGWTICREYDSSPVFWKFRVQASA